MVAARETRRGDLRSKLLALSGLGFVVLVLLAFGVLGGDTPGSGESASKIRSFYVSHENRETVAAFVLAASSFLIACFGVTLALAARPVGEPGLGFWQIVLAAGSAIAGALWILTAVVHFALTDAANSARVGGGALQALNVLDADTWVAFNAGLGVMMLGAAGSLVPMTGAFRILGWIALLAGIALFIPFADFVALIVTGLWLITASIVLFRRASATTPALGPV
jgi:hypothetical protein